MELRDIDKIRLTEQYGGFSKGSIGLIEFDGAFCIPVFETRDGKIRKSQGWLKEVLKRGIAKPIIKVVA